MADYYLEFEKPIKVIDEQIIELETSDEPDAHLTEIENLKDKRRVELERIFSGISRWQRVQLARHPKRPFSLDYINKLAPDFIELHGDRHYGDDPALVGGFGTIDSQTMLFIGQQKGRNTNENLFRNFGMMRPEGYRKVYRLLKLAEKFNVPVVSLIDTPGAYPGLGAEERGQGEAIAKNLMEMSRLRVPILVIVIGEGASGGALGIGVCDRMLMLENTWYSVISPEGCASILWRDSGQASNAADAMKITPKDLLEIGICDRIVAEPLGGAHRQPNEMADILKSVILEELDTLLKTEPDTFLDQRIARYDAMSVFTESS
ncbi:MAG: acetyl-CoA carboxylase carboxyltransferase subunit alpha [Candidatus Marinimicrobia bacterium]|jgi:acetyl-CoA carboxylase carboxyl transferase subunit alpha|nr:acetyl-CoA carboxylase carboxyl transferase subunit alpha [Candidatus Neomarinimicrobiota bacterium]MDP6499520.1 acetyl-CoA carboxylase carboxyltransferase subunit alpha [Candidatus Neomarinimicrobiota bacterium]MDP6726952.1 acetyl-CoA carboxylase carboxyltransferase subunit alpha [Candidatus Neomarinimicrobiota bacterium]|tara:strand:+ start:21580 stop:22536 length:957 start_codon:yes stop_codon:yes gene_type:complete